MFKHNSCFALANQTQLAMEPVAVLLCMVVMSGFVVSVMISGFFNGAQDYESSTTVTDSDWESDDTQAITWEFHSRSATDSEWSPWASSVLEVSDLPRNENLDTWNDIN